MYIPVYTCYSDWYGSTVGIDAVPVVRCNECKYYKESATEDRKMCFRKDIDGLPVCYEFEPNDWCSYAERREE